MRSTAPAAPAPIQAVASPNADTTSKPKPCCVCKDEKSVRDECMLMSKAANPEEDCQTTIQQYRACMETFGFKV
ncbi:hypothetical protein SAPIO_CDS3542 [Scedosporium apiospermum]|uniref:Cytochrome c oxidase copper chaperone n=1 Tax=Pseudallescheria apiosperma TaxID=563466 RepID=A0A084GB10_PSEDA|nr:uncharacterized protein SAPIO_CDS3542 [Scedosporium apiospermum]KEZ44522.1 hypothetical protein SAPIO_CDS3542 [Scedosporium apiospermum]